MQRKGPLPGKIFARCILRRRFAGLFGYMARISCQSQLVSDAWRANLARKGRFSHPRPLSGCMERKTCHGLPPGNAPRRNLATARPRERIAREYCHCQSGQERIRAQSRHRRTLGGERISRAFCHRRVSGNASGHNLAIARRPINTSMKNLHNRHLTIVYKSLTRNQAEYNKEIGF